MALARAHGDYLQRALDVSRTGISTGRGNRRACVSRGGGVCAGGGPDRLRPVVRAGSGGRQDRRRVLGLARRISRGRDAPCIGKPARSGRARYVRGAHRRNDRDRLAHRGGGPGGAGSGAARRAGDAALGAQPQQRVPDRAVRAGRRRHPGAGACAHRVALRARHRICGAVRHCRISGAGPLRAAVGSAVVERRGGVHAARDAGGALLSRRQVRALDPVRRRRPAPCGAVCAGDRNARQARAASRQCGRGSDLRHRRGRGPRACAHHRAGEGLAHHCARADGAGHRLGAGETPAAGAALARGRHRRTGGGAHRLGATHHGAQRRHHAGLQLATLWLRHSGRGVLAWRHACCAGGPTISRPA